MTKRKSDQEAIRGKLGGSGGGSFAHEPIEAHRGLVKSGEEESPEHPLEEELIRDLVREIVRKCGSQWCLYTKGKDKKTKKRRRLGAHSSKAGAYNQERAIKAHGG